MVERIGLRDVQEVIALVADVFPGQPVSEPAVLLLQDIFDRLNDGREDQVGAS